MLLTGLAALIAATLAVSCAHGWRELLLYRALQGLSASAFPPLILAYLNDHLAPPWRTRAITLMSLGFLTASIVAQCYALALQRHGYAWIEQTCLPIYAIALILVVVFIDGKPAGSAAAPSPWGVYRRIPALLFGTRLKWLYFSTLCTLSALVAFYLLLDRKYGVRFATAGIDALTTRLVALPAMFLTLLAPAIIARIGAIALIRWSFSIAALCLGLAAVAVLAGSAWGLLLASGVFIAGRAFSVPALVGSVGSLSDPAYRGAAISLYTFVLFLGASLGPILAHLLLPFAYPTALVLLAGVAGLPAVLTGFMQTDRRHGGPAGR